MKAAAFYGKGDVRIEERPMPVPGPNQLVVKINYVGVCGTDVEFYKGGYPPFVKLPMVLGHENVGTVTALGEGVTEFQVGDRILCGPPSHCAEDCPSCQRGETNICINGFPRTAGIGGPDGGYAEYFLVRDVKHTMLIKVPEGVDLEAYKDQLIERFSNKAISDQVSRLCGDGIAKFAVYVVPRLKQMLQDGKDISIEAFLIAVYCKYLIGARTESGENIAISEPHITPADRKLISGGSPAEFLKISPFVSLGLDKYPVFMEKYEQFYAMQVAEGLKVLLQ